MKYTIEFEEDTLVNFQKAINYYEKISEPLANRFHKDFWRIIGNIKEKPLQYQVSYRSIRIAHLNTFPYGIHFIIDMNVIRVFKILHHKQYYK